MDFKLRYKEFDKLTTDSEAKITITSSGSTGEPKKIDFSLSRLRQYIRTGERFENLRWATCFSPESFAGAVVALQAWVNKGPVIHLAGGDFRAVWDLLIEGSINALSVTPSFLRLLLLHCPSDELNIPHIKRITLGGEVVGGDIVKQAGNLWPSCAVRVIYASAELGVVFQSREFCGLYFPRDLNSHWRKYDVSDGQLILESRSEPGKWIETGDLAELDTKSGGIRMSGRLSRVVNVGGQKFSLDAIEQVIQSVDGVIVVKCGAVSNPIVGNVVSCAWSGPATEESIRRVCQAELPKPAWPRIWEPGAVVLSPNGKR